MSPSSLEIAVTLTFFQSCLKTPDLRALFITFANDAEIYGTDYLIKMRSIPNTSLMGLLVRDPIYVSISSLDIFLKRKLWILFVPFQKKIVIKILKFWVYFVANIGKTGGWNHSQKCHKYNMRVFIFTRYESFYFRPHFWRSFVQCMNSIEINILSLLDNTN